MNIHTLLAIPLNIFWISANISKTNFEIGKTLPLICRDRRDEFIDI